MASFPDHPHAHAHAHAHDHGHAPHGHPAQPLPWSLLRMGLWARLSLALGASAGLWLMTWLVS